MSPLGSWNIVVLGELAYFPVELHLPHCKLPTYPLEIIDIADRERLIVSVRPSPALTATASICCASKPPA